MMRNDVRYLFRQSAVPHSQFVYQLFEFFGLRRQICHSRLVEEEELLDKIYYNCSMNLGMWDISSLWLLISTSTDFFNSSWRWSPASNLLFISWRYSLMPLTHLLSCFDDLPESTPSCQDDNSSSDPLHTPRCIGQLRWMQMSPTFPMRPRCLCGSLTYLFRHGRM